MILAYCYGCQFLGQAIKQYKNLSLINGIQSSFLENKIRHLL